jgi:hypothetical protein
MTVKLPESLALVPLRSDWSESPVDPHRRTPMDDGEIAVTRKLTRIPSVQSVTWELSRAQMQLWRDFWAKDLDGGANWFEAIVVDGYRNSRRACRPSGETPWTAVSPAGGIYMVTLQLELREIASMSSAERIAFDAFVSCNSDVVSITARLAAINIALSEVL